MVTAPPARAIVDAMRRDATDYAGARGRISLEDALELGAGFALQEKRDGCYARVHLDGAGRVDRIFSRAGQELPRSIVADVLGARIGTPHAELVGELDAHTEAGNRAAAIAGYRSLTLFDCIRAGGRYLARAPYRERYRALCSMQVWAASSSSRWQNEEHGVRNVESGRWSPAILGAAGLERAPIVPLLTPAAARQVWDRARAGDAEGLVVVALEAELGARGAKRKVKPVDEHDALVVSADHLAATLEWCGRRVVVSNRGAKASAGDVVSFVANGFYDDGLPRFARISRVRADLGATL